MSTSARPPIAEENDRSRWDQARLRLLVPIGVIVAIAVACLIVGVAASARRANEVSLNREQQLIQDAIAARGAPCPTCGGDKLLVVGGDEMRLKEMEVT